MARLPACTPKEVLAALQRIGWRQHHWTGSHCHLRHPDKPAARVVVPMHSRDLPRPTLRLILKQAQLTEEEFHLLL